MVYQTKWGTHVEIIKVKGLTQDSISNLNVKTLSQLLDYGVDHKLEFNKSRWYRSISAGNICVKEQVYTLKVTGNKRKLIYENDKLVDTVPFIINENKEIVNNEQ